MRQQLIERTVQFVKEQLDGDSSGHDWFHIERVWATAKSIYDEENTGDLLVIELAALLHDLADSKLFDEAEGRQNIYYFLKEKAYLNRLFNMYYKLLKPYLLVKEKNPQPLKGRLSKMPTD